MGQVTVIVNGRSYRLKCGDGEEQRLMDLAEHVRQRIDDLSYEFGHAGDERLLLMATLMITDELWETKARLAAVEARRPAPSEAAEDVTDATDEVAKVASDAEPAAGPVGEAMAGKAPEAGPSPVQPPIAAKPPPVAATKPSLTGSQPAAPFVQEPSLQRALRRSPPKAGKGATLEDRLAEARESPGQAPRKTTGI
ncbi:MAG: cell division protein ZapA [Hyphomicrobiaceae bacterium]